MLFELYSGLSGLYLLQILNRDVVLMLSMMGQPWLEVREILVTLDQNNVNKFMLGLGALFALQSLTVQWGCRIW